MSRSVAKVVCVALVVSALAVEVRLIAITYEARSLHAAAGDGTRPLADRLTDARQAVSLRRDAAAYRRRAVLLEADWLVDTGRLDEARELLIEEWRRDRSYQPLREKLTEVNLARIARDSRKAHVLHGREKPGGVLLPEDLLP